MRLMYFITILTLMRLYFITILTLIHLYFITSECDCIICNPDCASECDCASIVAVLEGQCCMSVAAGMYHSMALTGTCMHVHHVDMFIIIYIYIYNYVYYNYVPV